MSRCFHPLLGYQGASGAVVLSSRQHMREQVIAEDPEARADYSVLELPCGKCIGCRSARARSWALRCRHEALLHDANCFVTLTYRDADLRDAVLSYRDFQLFMKRLRKNLTTRIRFFAAGEYGDRTHRPHFHALLFGADFRQRPYSRDLFESDVVDDAWQKGRALIGALTSESAAYVAQYAMKKIHGDDVDVKTGLVREPVVRMSQGIGRDWFNRFGRSDLRHGFASFDAMKVTIPRYYMLRMEEEYPELYARIKGARLERAKEIPLEERSDDRLVVQEQVAMARRAFFHRDREVES